MKNYYLKPFLIAVTLLLVSWVWNIDQAQAAVFEIDPEYSSIIFKARHADKGFTVGAFTEFGGFITTSDDDSRIEDVIAKVSMKSIYARSEAIEKNAQEMFLQPEKFPYANFLAKRFEGNKMIGDLTIHGKTKEIAFDYKFAGVGQDGRGRTKMGLLAKTVINRNDFGMNFNIKLDRGQKVFGDEVEVIIEVEGLLKE